MRETRLIGVVMILGCHSAAPLSPAPRGLDPDFTQAERMLELLTSHGPPTAAQVDAVVATPGTQLIVQQQNLSRKVTVEQYRVVLAAVAAEAAPAVEGAEEGERAARGVRGLRDEVWPALHWGTSHTDVLAERIAALRKLDVGHVATRLALEWLPEATDPPVRRHVVMGGRAGAAAIGADIYFDVLAMSHKASLGAAVYPSPAETIEFFAHETHHVGLAPIIEQTRSALAMNSAERRAFEILASLVTEGSATYFINAHHDLERMRRDLQYGPPLADADRLVATIERLLGDVLDRALDGEPFEKAVTPLIQSGYHCAGALMFDAIYRAGRRERVLAVLRDPRQLLGEYNRALASPSAQQLRPIDGALAARTAQLGDRAPTFKPAR